MKEPTLISDYDKNEKIVKEEIKELAEKTNNNVLKSLALEDNPEVKEHCEMARRIFRESIEMYEDGTLDFKSFIKDLSEALNAMEVSEENETEEEEKKSHGKDWKPENKEMKKEPKKEKGAKAYS